MFKCCYGISSKADQYEHVFMMDYDGYGLESVVNHLKLIQQEFNMSNIYIIESTNGYNAICLDTMALSLIYQIGNDIYSIADKDFVKYGFERGYYTLRFDEDKRLIRVLERRNERRKSTAHALFLQWFFNIDIDFDKTFNENTKIKVIQYPSNKNGYHLFEKELPSYLGVMNDKRQV